VQICSKGVEEPNEENQKVLIQQAQGLIKRGVKISEVFKEKPLVLAWLRTHCVEALQDRVAISKEGLELIDFDTLLPSNWQPPDWLLPARKLKISQEELKSFKPTKTEFDSSIRECLRPFATYLEENNLLSSRALSIFSALNMGVSYWLQDWRIMLVSGLALSPSSSFLNEQDLKNLQQKALKNPLYQTLWKKATAISPTELTCASLSDFLRQGMTAKDVSKAYHEDGKITIYRGMSSRHAFEALIFESVNAFHKEHFLQVDEKLDQGELSREEYTRLSEYVEWHSVNLYHQIMDFGKENLGWLENEVVASHEPTFKKDWEHSNTRYPLDKTNSHADHYRNQWDQQAFLYFLRHPEKAPLDEDWLNKIRNFDQTPLQVLILHPEFAMEWEKDPFIQLIEKGSVVDSDLITQICRQMVDSQGTSTPDDTAIQVARIKELQKRGMSLPTNLSSESKSWLEKNL
jgi:hypothetical protein